LSRLREIANSEQDKHQTSNREGILRILRVSAIHGQTMHPTWPSQELHAMLGQRVRDPLSLLRSEPQWGLTLIELLRPYFFGLNRRNKSNGGNSEETVNSIDFSHSNCKAWNTLNKLTGRSGRSSRLCPVSIKSIASQLMKNGAYKNGGREDNFFRNHINLLERFAKAEKNKLCIHDTLNEVLISIGKF